MKSILLTTIISLAVLVSSAQDFYVSTIGNDNNPGTQKQPFATISHAKEMVRKWNRINGNENITVWLAGGEYRQIGRAHV